MVKKGYGAEASRRDYLQKQGWLVFRVSGSIGPIDLVAFKPNNNNFDVRLEQVKYCSQDKYRPSRRDVNEMLRCLLIQSEYKVPVFWVVKYKGRKDWEEFTVEEILKGGGLNASSD
jgi:Holliday junction resolvase-like predicted endonuclease